MTWTSFYDMSSGGGNKEDFQYLFVEAPYREAISVFYSRYGHHPLRITCNCCGPDYSVDSEDDSLEEITYFYRNQSFIPYTPHGQSLEEFLAEPLVAVIYESEISDSERLADVPRLEWDD